MILSKINLLFVSAAPTGAEAIFLLVMAFIVFVTSAMPAYAKRARK